MIRRAGALLGALAALAALTAPGTQPAAAAEPATLLLIDQTFVVPGVATTAEDGLSITVAGSALTPVCANAADDLLSVISYRPVTTRAQANAALEGPDFQVDRVDVGLCGVTPLDNGAVRVRVPTTPTTESDPATAPTTLRLPAAGVIPIGVEVSRNGEVTASLTTFVDRLEAGADATSEVDERMQVAVALAVDGGPTLRPDGSIAVGREDQDAVAELIDLIETVGDAPLTVAVRPELLEGLSESGSPLVPQLRSAIAASDGLDLLAWPYVGLDPTAAARAGLGDTFLTQFTLGDRVLSDALRVQPSRAVWFVPQALGEDGAQLLAQAGVRLVALLPPAAFSLSPSDRQFLVPVQSGSVAATPVDRDIAALLDDPGPDPTLTAYRIAAQVLLTRAEALDPPQGYAPMTDHNMILSTSDGSLGDPTTTATLVSLLAETPQLSLVSASTIGGIPHPIMTDAGVPAEVPAPDVDVADLRPLGEQLTAATADADATSSMLPAADPRPAAWRSLIDVMPSSALTDEQRGQYVAAVSADTAAVRAAVVPPPSRRFTLGGRQSTLRLLLRNDGDTDLTVRLIVESSKLEIDDPNRLVPLPAGETTEVEIPVDARTNGEFPVDIRLTTPEGDVEVAPPVTMTAHAVNALTGLGQLATGEFVLVLLTWWLHHFRQRRRRAAAAAAAATP